MRKLKYVQLFESFMMNENKNTDEFIVVYKDNEKKEYETSFGFKIINKGDESFDYHLEKAKSSSSKHGIPVKFLDQSDSLIIIFNSHMNGVLMGKFNKCDNHGQYDGWIPGDLLASRTYGEFGSKDNRAQFMGFVFNSDLENFISKNNLKEYGWLRNAIEKTGIKIIEK